MTKNSPKIITKSELITVLLITLLTLLLITLLDNKNDTIANHCVNQETQTELCNLLINNN